MSNQQFPPNFSGQVRKRNTFSTREVGVTHPDGPGYIRIADNGDIYIMADDGLGMIFSYKNRSCTIMADTIRFLTTETEGLAWNGVFFNPAATTYSQPTFHAPTGMNVKNVFKGAETYYTNRSNAYLTPPPGYEILSVALKGSAPGTPTLFKPIGSPVGTNSPLDPVIMDPPTSHPVLGETPMANPKPSSPAS